MEDNKLIAMTSCPPHQWAHAPTVGYYSCIKCRGTVYASDPRYEAVKLEYQKALSPSNTRSSQEVGEDGRPASGQPCHSAEPEPVPVSALAGECQAQNSTIKCPECGKPFSRARISEHLLAAHGIA